jgi:hypothetical protein
LYLIGSGNLVFNQVATPAAPVLPNADNNYLDASLGAGYALGKKTDLHLDLTHYRARDFSDNSATSLPYGANQETNSASVTSVVRQNENLVYTLKYTYAINHDDTSGGHNDFRASLLYAKVQLLF